MIRYSKLSFFISFQINCAIMQLYLILLMLVPLAEILIVNTPRKEFSRHLVETEDAKRTRSEPPCEDLEPPRRSISRRSQDESVLVGDLFHRGRSSFGILVSSESRVYCTPGPGIKYQF